MPWRDIAALLENIAEHDAQAARDAENLAMLVDRDDFWLNSEYAHWITDPDDPEVKAERARRRRAGITPPPTPLLRPVALRPPALAAMLREKYETTARTYADPPRRDAPVTKMSAREAAALLWSG